MNSFEKKVSVIIPAFNEASSIAETVTKVKALPVTGEVIVVDDGSTDKTAELAQQNGALVIRHETNRGYGASLKTGIRSARYSVVGFVDADGQQNPQDLLDLSKYIDEYDMVIGARDNQSHFPLWRRPGKKLIGTLANYLAGAKIPDFNSGLRVIKKDLILPYLKMLPDGFSFSTTSTIFFIKEGYRTKYIPIIVKKRKGKSSLNAWHGLDTIILVLRLITMFEPLKIFLPASIIIFMVGLIWALREFILFRSFGATSIFLGLTALLVFFAGLISDQIASLRKELK